MLVIPVVDIRDGHAVRAVGGKRANYRPIETPLSPGSSDPVDVAAGLLGLFDEPPAGHGALTLYVAELDGIEGRGRNWSFIDAIAGRFPDVRLLVDDGSRSVADLMAYREFENVVPVIGSETLGGVAALGEIDAALGGRFALSLDWRGDDPIGPCEVFAGASSWPQTVIVMTLARVGLRSGPDFARLAEVVRLAGGREVLAAGGVRGVEDLKLLRGSGAAGALVATALHDGALGRAELSRLGRG